MRILLTGGGTGGHVMPILAIMAELERLTKEKIEFLWVGSKGGIESIIARENKITFKAIFCGKWRRYFSLQNIIDIFKIPIGIVQAVFIIKDFNPQVVFGKGGYVSIPVIVASWILRKPILIHESDAIPGLANKLLVKFASKIAITFKQTEKFFPKEKCVLTGNPVRMEILAGSKKRGYREFGLEYNKPIILVIGGSQGAQTINRVIIEVFSKLVEKYQIIHICGERNFKEVKEEIGYHPNYHLFAFLQGQKMADILACADLVISRAGSNVISEIAALGKPSILIPLPSAASDHQRRNAYLLKKAKAAIVIEEKNLTPKTLIGQINKLFENFDELELLGANVLSLAKPYAARKIGKEILEMTK